MQDEGDAQLDAIAQAYPEGTTSHDALAAALLDYAALAREHREAIEGLGGLDPALIEEAGAIATQLRERSAASPTEREREARDHLQTRNRLAFVLQRKMGLVRAAARFVCREHPAVARESASAYERRRRAAARRRASGAASTQPAPTPEA